MFGKMKARRPTQLGWPEQAAGKNKSIETTNGFGRQSIKPCFHLPTKSFQENRIWMKNLPESIC